MERDPHAVRPPTRAGRAAQATTRCPTPAACFWQTTAAAASFRQPSGISSSSFHPLLLVRYCPRVPIASHRVFLAVASALLLWLALPFRFRAASHWTLCTH